MPSSWHDVDVEMGDALAHPVVHGDEAPLRRHRLLHGPGEEPGGTEKRLDQAVGEVRKGHDVLPGNEEEVTGKQGAPVEEGEGGVIGKDDDSRDLPTDDSAEPAFPFAGCCRQFCLTTFA